MLIALKIIGLIILIIVLLVLLLAALVLFVPVRYKILLNKSEDQALSDISVNVKVSWLLHILSVCYDRSDQDVKIKLLGIRLKRKNKDTGEELPGDTPDKESHEDSKPSNLTEESTGSVADSTGGNDCPDALNQKKDICDKENRKKEKTSGFSLKKFFESIKKKIKRFMRKISGIISQIKKWLDFVRDERTEAAIKTVLRALGDLIKMIMPKHVAGKVVIGFEDVYKTGQLLAAAGIFYPLYGKELTVLPDFEREVMSADMVIKGRIFIISAVMAAVKVYFNKDFKFALDFLTGKEGK